MGKRNNSKEIVVSLQLNSLTLVSIVMLIAIGLAVIYGLFGMINLTHGEFVTTRAYSVAAVQLAGNSFWIGFVVAPLVGAMVGFLVEWENR
ncbi:ABC transporter permease subunit [Brucella anthropi]|uniref:ABC transporter permease subunit n=1 Tax=Brucella anthropi TaxID=529 RepID=UPI00124E088A|nr:hypothetical protein [Brucella anthropi]KAB2726488.1 hypothetical protein F9K76_07220 [Brucella anthropi]KAB2743650.1 hypothetical protein F9K74_07165 [Brucella anthropi]KAB2804397.1 hypothetical protein F9K83_07165 [Brucella anthropi]